MSAEDAFFEEDESLKDVRAAFDRGEKFVTAPRPRGLTLYFDAVTARAVHLRYADGAPTTAVRR